MEKFFRLGLFVSPLLSCLIFSCGLDQPAGYLTGKILDRAYNPISNAMVEIAGLKSVTNDDGQYFIAKIPPGEHELILNWDGRIQRYLVKIESDSIRTFDLIVNREHDLPEYINSFGQKNRLIPVDGDVLYVSPAPDGTSLAVEIFGKETQGSAIWQIDLNGTSLRVLEDLGAYDKEVTKQSLLGYEGLTVFEGNPIWLPDGKKIVYQTNVFRSGERRDFYIWLFDLGTRQRKLIDRGFTPNLARDGKSLVYSKVTVVQNDRLNWDIWLYDLAQNKPAMRLTKSPTKEQYPCWGAIDTKEVIYYSALTAGHYEIWRMNSDGSNPIQISDVGNQRDTEAFGPMVSPDGMNIVFWSVDLAPGGVESNEKIWLMDSNGAHARVLVEGGANPVWSPDGKFVYFVARRNLRWQVWQSSIG